LTDAQRESRLQELNEEGNRLFDADRFAEATAVYGEAVALLTPADAHHAPPLYENLGLALINRGRWRPAIRALDRAIDQDPAGRAQALAFLVAALALEGLIDEARRRLAEYEGLHGPHPLGWTAAELDRRQAEQRRRLAHRRPG
jgi:tetratricopeptide (TPR) repeat protein